MAIAQILRQISRSCETLQTSPYGSFMIGVFRSPHENRSGYAAKRHRAGTTTSNSQPSLAYAELDLTIRDLGQALRGDSSPL